MKVKTSTLTGPALDWAVQRALGTHWSPNGYFCFDNPKRYDSNPEWRYSTDWSQGGPIIEREGLCLKQGHSGWWIAYTLDVNDEEHFMTVSANPLATAMRCYVASKLGDEVDVPEELLS